MYCSATILALALSLATTHARPSHESLPVLQTLGNTGVANMRSGLGIYDGTSTTIDKHPYLVGVLVAGSFFCAGTIVNENWVVTLADCTKGLYASEVTVVSGSSDGSSGTSHSVDEIVPHPSYGTSTLDYDFTLLKINGNFTWSNVTKSAKLPKKETKSVSLTVVGYGETKKVDGVSQRELLEGNMTWLSSTSCQSYYSYFNLTSRMACAYDEGETTLCKGDYGDPFVKNSVYFGHFISGASSGFCTSKASPVILADILSVAHWIRTTIKTFFSDILDSPDTCLVDADGTLDVVTICE